MSNGGVSPLGDKSKQRASYRTEQLSTLLLAIVLVCGAISPSLASTPELVTGMRLIDALKSLQSAGLNIIYSSRVVQNRMRVTAVPQSSNLEALAAAVLAEHQLSLQKLPSGAWVVVRRSASTENAEEPRTDSPEEIPLIEIYASRYRIGTQLDSNRTEFLQTQMQELPGLDEDALRVTRFLPGIANNGFSAKTHVRGGRDDETLVLFDDIPMHAPYHFKDFGAVLGLFDTAVTQQAELYTGIFPTRYGGKLSAVMSVEPRQASDHPHHELGLSMLSLRGLSSVKGRFRDHDIEWLVSARTSVIKELVEVLGSDKYQPEFSDALLRGKTTLGEWDFTLGALFLDDRLHIDAENDAEDDVESSLAPKDEADARYRDSTLWMHADREAFGVDWRVSLATSERHTDRSGEIFRPQNITGSVEDIREANSQYFRLEARSASGWSSGIEAQTARADYRYIGTAMFVPELAAIFDRPTAFERHAELKARGDSIAWYSSYAIPLNSKWRVDGGLRVGHHKFETRIDTSQSVSTNRLKFDDTAISPRLAVEYAWRDSLTFRASAGQLTQADRPDELLVAEGDAGFHRLQRATQFVLSLEKDLLGLGSLRFETYRKEIDHPAPRYENLLDPLTLLPELEIDRIRLEPDSALLYGLELSGRFDLSPHWSVWGGYTWAEAKDRFGDIDITRSWNQQHSVAGGVTWRRGPWTISLHSMWHSGWRRTPFNVIGSDDNDTHSGDNIVVVRNAADWPEFFSSDLRVMWNRPLEDSVLRVHLDIINLSQHSNPCCTELAAERSQPGVELTTFQKDWLPRYALAGVVWEF